MASVKKVNVAIVGCGAISHAHVHGVHASKYGNLAIVMDASKDAAKALAQIGNCRYTTEFDDILKSKHIDIVIIASPHFLHAEQAVAAAKAKKHIYLEKPMALSTADAGKIITAAKRHKVKLMVGHNYRFKPGAAAIKKIIDKKVLGRIYEIRMQFVADIYDVVVKGKWRQDPKKAGGGCLLELGIHEIDMIRFWMGAEPDRVYAEMSYLKSKPPVERLACVMLGFKDAVCYLDTGYQHRAHYVKEIHGEKGSLTINAFPDRNVIHHQQGQDDHPVPIPEEKNGGNWIATQKFVDAVATGKKVPLPAEDAKKSTDIMLAAYLSAKEKRVVKLPLKEKVALPL